MMPRDATTQRRGATARPSCQPQRRIVRIHPGLGRRATDRTALAATNSMAHQSHGTSYARETETSTMPQRLRPPGARRRRWRQATETNPATQVRSIHTTLWWKEGNTSTQLMLPKLLPTPATVLAAPDGSQALKMAANNAYLTEWSTKPRPTSKTPTPNPPPPRNTRTKTTAEEEPSENVPPQIVAGQNFVTPKSRLTGESPKPKKRATPQGAQSSEEQRNPHTTPALRR